VKPQAMGKGGGTVGVSMEFLIVQSISRPSADVIDTW
jgi:hypothetical protein